MPLLKRLPGPVFDGHLTYFTVSQAHEFRRLVAASFAEVGREVDVYPDRIEDRAGTTIGLWNIGALCAGTDEREWSQLIDEHVRLVATPTRDLSDLTEVEFASGLTLRLVATASRNELSAQGPLAALVGLGRDNLRALLADEAVRAGAVGGGARGSFTVVRGESPFTASLALLLPETMTRFSGDDDWGRGVLVAVPSRHELLYRPIDAADARLALQFMLQAAFLGFHDDVGRLSPDVFWVRKQRWVQVTSSAGGKPRVLRGTGLREALGSF